MDIEKNKGFKEGAKAMRDILANEFARLGPGRFTGDEVALLIRQAPGPTKEHTDKAQANQA